MKKVNFLATVVLASNILGGMVTFADEGKNTNTPTEIKTTAEITFSNEGGEEPGEPGEGGEITPPEGGGEVEPEPGGETPGETADLMIVMAPNFDFGTQKIAAKGTNYPAINQLKIKDQAPEQFLTHFVQVRDVRGTHAGWNLKVQATSLKAEDGTSKDLNTSSITFANAHIAKNDSGAIAPSTTLKEIKLSDGSEATTIMNAQKDAGEGTWSLVMGTDYLQNTPKNTEVNFALSNEDAPKLSQTKYSSELTWTLEGAPAASEAATPKA